MISPEERPVARLSARVRRHLHRPLQHLIDIAILSAAFFAAYLLRFDFSIPQPQEHQFLVQLPFVVLIQFVCLALTGIYAFVWRYIGLADVHAFLEAALGSAAPLVLLRLVLPDRFHLWRVPLSVIVIDTLLAFGGLLVIRVLRRVEYEHRQRHRDRLATGSGKRKRTLLVGAGKAGVMAVRELQGRGDTALEICGFVDDAPEKAGSVIHGVKVVGGTRDIPRLVRELGIDQVVLTIVEAARRDIRRILAICKLASVKVQIVPGLWEILEGKVQLSRLRDVQIEDLLGREPVRLDEDALRAFLAGKRILVTGAGGTIGCALAAQAGRYDPARLILVERSEYALFQAERNLRQLFPELPMAARLLDISDSARMTALLAAERPQVLLHAAAHKHVPLMEFNAAEALRNNTLATFRLGRLAAEADVEVFVLISTDKAVRPTSVMGASKRVAELAIQTLDQRHACRFLAVRFGNVLGSTGSVIPIFREQIDKGGPLTVTHPQVTRYFMTPSEAAQLVLQAGAMGEGGEIFVLDMGEPVRILDLAQDMIALSGLKPFEQVDIVFTGLRPGEKLYEELELSGENIAKTRHPKIFIGRLGEVDPERIERALQRLEDLAEAESDGPIRAYLGELLPEAELRSHPEVAMLSAEPPVPELT